MNELGVPGQHTTADTHTHTHTLLHPFSSHINIRQVNNDNLQP